jgi:phytoene dehydrogenase-like protein
MARLGFHGVWSAGHLARRFTEPRTKALIAGCAGHSVLPLSSMLTAGLSLAFLAAGHLRPWPVAEGGSVAITRALERVCRSRGVTFETGHEVRSISELPEAKAVLFDTAPKQLREIAADALPDGYLRRLERFRMGPGVFKVDWALDGPIPWRNPRCLEAATVHVGGTFDEIAESERRMYAGELSDRPYLIVTQPSLFDPSRAPPGKHTAYAYCHVPSGCGVDRTSTIEAQVERFAPGFVDRILARHETSPKDLENYNPSYVGGAITGGVNDLSQFLFRPAPRPDPYTTPNPKLFLCSQSTPPGGGVHGMCGWHAAGAVLKRVFR